MTEITEIKIKALKKYIKDNFEEKEYEEIFIELIKEFKDKLGYKIVMIVMTLTHYVYKDLEGDFRLLRKACSENLTINKQYAKKELGKSKETGDEFLEDTTMKNIMLASTRFNKEKFPEYMPTTCDYLPTEISDKEIKSARDTKEFLMQDE